MTNVQATKRKFVISYSEFVKASTLRSGFLIY
jgi:hypothetical protein